MAGLDIRRVIFGLPLGRLRWGRLLYIYFLTPNEELNNTAGKRSKKPRKGAETSSGATTTAVAAAPTTSEKDLNDKIAGNKKDKEAVAQVMGG